MKIEDNTEIKRTIHSSKAKDGRVYITIAGNYVMKCKDTSSNLFIYLKDGDVWVNPNAELTEVECKLVVG